MKIIFEAEVMERREPVETPMMYFPGTVRLKIKVQIGRQEFGAETFLRTDEVDSVYDHVVENLARNVKERIRQFRRSDAERVPLMPVITFQQVRGEGGQ